MGLKKYIDNQPYGTIIEAKGQKFYKFTSYHSAGKTVDEMLPDGYKCLKVHTERKEIAAMNIYICMIEAV